MIVSLVNRKQLKNIDLKLIFATLLIAAFGITNVYSTTHAYSGFHYAELQLLWVLLGLVLAAVIVSVDFRIIKNYSEIIYWATVALLTFNDITSKAVKGASSWIRIGSRAIEPGEFVKIGLFLILSKKVEDFDGDVNNPKNLLKLGMYAAIPMILIVIQPNIGMTLICFFIAFGILYIAELDIKIIWAGILSAVPLSLLIWFSGLLKTYQKERIISFLNPGAFQQDISFQLTQSLIAIGSGGVLGKGLLNGTLVSGNYVPEVHTDFIFAAVGEEWGLIGAAALVILYGFLIFRIIKLSKEPPSIMERLICVGVKWTLCQGHFK